VLTLDVTEVKAMTAFMPLTSSGTSACPVSSFSRGEPVRPCPKEHAPHGALRGDSRSSPVTAGSLFQEYDKGSGRKAPGRYAATSRSADHIVVAELPVASRSVPDPDFLAEADGPLYDWLASRHEAQERLSQP
jgi:hypothetical protein